MPNGTRTLERDVTPHNQREERPKASGCDRSDLADRKGESHGHGALPPDDAIYVGAFPGLQR